MARVRAQRRYRNAGLRRTLQTNSQNINRLGSRPPIGIVEASKPSPSTLYIAFDQGVIIKGLPQYRDTFDQLPVDISVESSFEIILSYPGASDFPYTVPFEDYAVRNDIASFVAPQVLVIPP